MSFNRLEQSRFFLSRWLYDRFLQLIIYPSIWVAAAIASLGIFTQEILQLESNWQAIALIFFTALIPYNLDRIFDSYVQEIPDTKAQLFFRQPCIWVLLLTAIIATAILLYDAPSSVRYVSIAGIIPLLYGTPLFPLKNQSRWQWYRLKDLPGSKAWIVGSILTYAVIALPMAYVGAKYDVVAALTTLFMFVFIVTNSHIFDIRDLESDRHKGVVTLPIIAGIRGTKTILTVMNILMLLTIIGAGSADIMTYHPEIIIATAINLIYIRKVNTDTPRWVYSILIEACLFVPILANWVIYKL
ncbi:MAG: prenyltransferase [Xenococcaceae cyanobacterium MO_188.B29]|nr:prenyltransferase [Xenococcaceae cyanobacterium MO_188.B29]